MNKEGNSKVVKPEPIFAQRCQTGEAGILRASAEARERIGTDGLDSRELPPTSYSVKTLIREHLRPTISPALLSVVAGEMETQIAGSGTADILNSSHLLDIKHQLDQLPPTHIASDLPPRLRIDTQTEETQDQELKFILPSSSPLGSYHHLADERLLHQLQPQNTLTTLSSLDRLASYQQMPPVHHPSVQFSPPSLVSTDAVDGGGMGAAEPLYVATNHTLGAGLSPHFLHVNNPTSGGSGPSSMHGSPGGSVSGLRPFNCDECGKGFQNNSALVKHKLIHSDERRYICELCNKAFKRQDHLTGHLNVHKAVKPFQCVKDGCDKSYCDGRSLRRHLEHGHNIRNPVVHSQKGMMYVRCEEEEFALPMHTSPVPKAGRISTGSRDGSQDGRHRNSSGETNTSNSSSQEISPGGMNSAGSNGSLPDKEKGPVECTQCGRTFKNIPALNGHMRLHSGVHRERVAAAAAEAVNSAALFSASQLPHNAGIPHSQPLLPSLPGSMQYRACHDDVVGMQDGLYNLHNVFAGRHFIPGGDLYHQPPAMGNPAPNPSLVHMDTNFERENSGQALTMLSATANLSHPTSPSSPAVAPGASQHHQEDPLATLDLCSPDLMPREVDDESIQKELEALSVDFPDLGTIDAATGVLQPPDHHDLTHSAHMVGDAGNIRKRHPTAPSGLSSMGSSSSSRQWESPAVPPPPSMLRQRRKSKGKPENVCQLLKTSSSGIKGSQGIALTSHQSTAGSLALSSSWSHTVVANGNGNGNGPKRVKSKSGSLACTRSPKNLRPKPPNLIIPAFPGPINRFHSQLRSPRFWEGPVSADGSTGSKSPPPYTPPPILSPMRHGSGLFWTINKQIKNGMGLLTGQIHTEQELFSFWMEGGMPKSAPIVPPARKCSLLDSMRSRKASRADSHGMESQMTEPAFFGNMEISKSGDGVSASVTFGLDASLSQDRDKEGIPSGVLPALPPLEIADRDDFVPPETDLTPHINIGFYFQAEVDNFCIKDATAEKLEKIQDKADLVFHPSSAEDISPEQLRLYMKFACSSAVDGGGRNKELAYHLLHLKNGSISDCILTLMDKNAVAETLSSATGLANYKYVDTSVWPPEEVQKFQTALFQHEKFFTEVSKEIPSRSVKECINFYYTWKKVCTDEYRKLKKKRRAELLQRRQQQDAGVVAADVGNYNLRSQNQPPEPDSPKDLEEPRSVKSEITVGNYEREELGSVMSGDLSEERSQVASRNEYDSDPATPSEPTRKKPKVVKYGPRVPGGIPDENGEFPCRLCGKVFAKVKSRNAHMKSHAMKGER